MASSQLTEERIVKAAVSLADGVGTERLTIRSIAAELGSSPMSIYHYLPDKNAILDAMVDSVFEEIGRPTPGQGWRTVLEARAHGTRSALRSHPWAASMLDSRMSPGLETLGHQDQLIGVLRSAGIAMEMVGHMVATIDAFVYGFAVQETTLPFTGPEEVPGVVEEIMGGVDPLQFEHLTAMATEVVLKPGYDFGDEFAYGLNLILDAFELRISACD